MSPLDRTDCSRAQHSGEMWLGLLAQVEPPASLEGRVLAAAESEAVLEANASQMARSLRGGSPAFRGLVSRCVSLSAVVLLAVGVAVVSHDAGRAAVDPLADARAPRRVSVAVIDDPSLFVFGAPEEIEGVDGTPLERWSANGTSEAVGGR
jgi:hypothetical protein